MKYSIETTIEAPIEEVAELVGDPTKWGNWMEGLVEVEHLEGTPGMPDSESKLTFETRGTTMVMHGRVVKRDLPDEFLQTMEAPHVVVRISTKLEQLSPKTTKHISTQSYEFDGLKDKLIGQVLRWTFKNQTKRHVENFKAFAESSYQHTA